VLRVAGHRRAGTTAARRTAAGKNLYVRDRMTDIYFWCPAAERRSGPVRHAGDAEAIRFQPIDHSYSFITTAHRTRRSFPQPVHRPRSVDDGVGQRMPCSGLSGQSGAGGGPPAQRSILELNGRAVTELIAGRRDRQRVRPSEVGVQVSILFKHPVGERIAAMRRSVWSRFQPCR
jgi:hypothetical protein